MGQSELIQKLEQASEGSRELDARIVCALEGLVFDEICQTKDGKRHVDWRNVPHYTTSLDAALPGENIAHVHAPEWHSSKPAGRWQAAVDIGEGRAVYGYGKTEALALCIASLKAIEAENE